MSRFTLKITEAGKVLGETEIALPVLRFVPEVAATVIPSRGEPLDLLGWAGGL